MNEEALGKAVKRAIADGLVTREELFITTKVWVQDEKKEETAYEAVKTCIAEGTTRKAGTLLKRYFKDADPYCEEVGPVYLECAVLKNLQKLVCYKLYK